MGDRMLDTWARIEALLFFKGEALSVRFLAETLELPENEVQEGIATLTRQLNETGRGVVVVSKGDEIMLSTAPTMSSTLEKLEKNDLEKELGKAALETLSIVLYRGPLAQSSINHIRGVNSNYIIRNLLVRGLIEKHEDKETHRTTYRPTFELLSYLGITKVEDLPEYNQTKEALDTFSQEQQPHDNQEDKSIVSEA